MTRLTAQLTLALGVLAGGVALAPNAEAAQGSRWKVRASMVAPHIARLDANKDGWVTSEEAARKTPTKRAVHEVSAQVVIASAKTFAR